LPAGGGGLAAGVDPDAEGAGGGNGPELTTPDGVSTGNALVGAGDAAGDAVTGASAGGFGCEEQLTSAV